MCVASAITDYHRDLWPTPSFPSPLGPKWNTGGVWITKEQYDEYLKLKRAAEDYDAKTNQPECIKPEVAQWESEVVQYLIKGETNE